MMKLYKKNNLNTTNQLVFVMPAFYLKFTFLITDYHAALFCPINPVFYIFCLFLL